MTSTHQASTPAPLDAFRLGRRDLFPLVGAAALAALVAPAVASAEPATPRMTRTTASQRRRALSTSEPTRRRRPAARRRAHRKASTSSRWTAPRAV